MAEYIERQKVIEMLENAALISDDDGEYSGYCTEDVDIESIPAADVAPVVHGKWFKSEYETISPMGRTIKCKKVTCSACGKSNGRSKTNYCPNCGAKMDGDRHE